MCTKAFLQKLAIERCQHSLAQLCAVTLLKKSPKEEKSYDAEMMTLLVEMMNRDLEFLDRTLEQSEEAD